MEKYTKVLFIGDLHFKTTNNDITDLVIEQCLSHLDNILTQHNSSEVLCCLGGDLLDTHERIHQTPYNKILNFIDKLRQKVLVVILVGNHDYENNQQFMTKKHWLNPLKEWKNVRIVDKALEISDFVFCPYVPVGRFKEALNTIEYYEWKNAKCIFAHQEFRGCILSKTSHSPSGDVWEIGLPMVISGHIHKAQKLQENIIYPGSAGRHNFGEEDNSVNILFADFSNNPELTYLPLDLPLLYTIKIPQDKFTETMENLTLKPLQKIRVICEGTREELKAINKSKLYSKCDPSVTIILREIKDANFSEEETILFDKYTDVFKLLVSKYDPELNYIYENLKLGKTFEEIFEEFVDNEEFTI